MSLLKPNRAVCYTTDAGYLFPSFVSAQQAKRALTPGVAEVVILAIDVDGRARDVFASACEQEGIVFRPISSRAIDGASPYYARFFLADLLPSHIDTFLYVDSDTQITRPLDPLMSFAIPEGQFLAVTDPMVFALPNGGRLSRDLQEHFTSLNLPTGQVRIYFNSGVLMTSRTVWQDVGSRSWAIACAQPRDTRFPDQDVLNHAADGRNLPLSLAWNFPVYMMNLRVTEAIRPGIVHYMSSPKPWQGVFPPWTRREYDLYSAALRDYPALADFRSTMAPARRLRYHLQQRYKRFVEQTSLGRREYLDRILDYEHTALLSADRVGASRFGTGQLGWKTLT